MGVNIVKELRDLWDWIVSSRRGTPKGRVVVVEDNKTDADLILASLLALKIKAEWAENAEQAKAMLRRNQIRIVFLDMRLMYLPGWVFLHRIQEESPHTHVVITCTCIEDVGKVEGLPKYFGVLIKPCTPERLLPVFSR